LKFELSKKATLAVKWIFSFLLLAFLAYKINSESGLQTFNYLSQILGSPVLILVLIYLSFVNWFFDTLSWKLIAPQNKSLKFSKILSANLISQYLGLLTPFGLGEYRAKMRVFSVKQERNQSVVSTISYRWSKAAAKFGLGIIAVTFLIEEKLQNFNTVLLLLALAVWLLFIVKYKFFLNLVFKWFGLKSKLKITAKSVNIYPTLLPATLKFLSYVLQFALIAMFFTETTLAEAVVYGIILYSVASLLPQLSVLDPFVKGGVGAIILPNLPPEIILTATFFVWVLNVGLPSIAGAVLWFRKT